jgi:cystathionine beta-lyase
MDEHKKSAKNYSDATIAIHAGSQPFENFGVVNPPIYHASTILFETYAEFKSASEGKSKKAHYGRHGSDSHRQLEAALAALEGADKCLLTSSGVQAISCALLAFLDIGDELLMVDSAYAPTRDFCNQELARYGISVRYYDPLVGGGIAEQISDKTKIVFVESPGSLTFEVQDIPAITKAAHAKNALVIMDNTWASPINFKAFSHGVDVSIHSATKYISGHSDLLMGVINCTDATYARIKRVYKNLGICPGADDVYLAHRGLRTLATRIKAQGEAALKVAKWLAEQPQVERVLHPQLPTCKGHEIFARDFVGASGLFSFMLKKKLSEAELSKFFDQLDLFKMGYSWGGYESLAIHFDPTKIRTATKWAAAGSAIRLSIGLEDVDDLIADLAAALKRIS